MMKNNNNFFFKKKNSGLLPVGATLQYMHEPTGCASYVHMWFALFLFFFILFIHFLWQKLCAYFCSTFFSFCNFLFSLSSKQNFDKTYQELLTASDLQPWGLKGEFFSKNGNNRLKGRGKLSSKKKASLMSSKEINHCVQTQPNQMARVCTREWKWGTAIPHL